MASAVVIVSAAFAAGVGVGAIHFALLERMTRRLTSGRGGLGLALSMPLRLAATGAVLAGAAIWGGAGGLLAAALGVTLARFVVLRREKQT